MLGILSFSVLILTGSVPYLILLFYSGTRLTILLAQKKGRLDLVNGKPTT